MKIKIEHEWVCCEVSSSNVVTLDDALVLIKQALLGVGFLFKGELTIKDDDLNDYE